MKIYFTTDTICDETCETKCPVIEGKFVGSCKCQECKYCYGYSGDFPQWIIELIFVSRHQIKRSVSYKTCT